MTQDFSEWKKDLCAFLKTSDKPLPPKLGESIRRDIALELNPKPWFVFLKLVIIVAFAGGTSLIFCPQFGLSLTHNKMGMMHYFMLLGPHFCMAACGAVFLGSGGLLAGLAMTPAELALVRRRRVLYLPAIAACSLALLVCAGAQVLLAFGALWILGSAIGATLLIELGARVRLTGARLLA